MNSKKEKSATPPYIPPQLVVYGSIQQLTFSQNIVAVPADNIAQFKTV